MEIEVHDELSNTCTSLVTILCRPADCLLDHVVWKLNRQNIAKLTRLTSLPAFHRSNLLHFAYACLRLFPDVLLVRYIHRAFSEQEYSAMLRNQRVRRVTLFEPSDDLNSSLRGISMAGIPCPSVLIHHSS